MRKNVICMLVGLSILFILSGTGFALDTLVVEQGINKISEAFAADTTAGVDLSTRVYKLQLNGIYLQNEGIFTRPGQPLNIVGETGDGAPPLIQPLTDESGNSPDAIFNLKENSTFKNLAHNNMDDLGTQKESVYRVSEDSVKVVFENLYAECVMNGVVAFDANGFVVEMRDCKFYNLGRDTHPMTGKPLDCGANQPDSVIFENNTVYNAKTGLEMRVVPRYVKINHNTFVAVLFNTIVDNGGSRWWKGEITNNLFIDCDVTLRPWQWVYGDELYVWNPEDSVIALAEGLGITGANVLDIDSLNVEVPWPAEEKHLLVENNNHYTSQEVNNWMETTWGDSVKVCTDVVFINDYDLAYCSRHPEWFDVEQATSLDPGFVKRSVLPNYVENYLIPHLDEMGVPWYSPTTPAAEWDWPEDDETVVDENGLAVLEWPVLNDFSYTNADLLTAGNDGFPLGDLNWFPDKKAEWETWLTGVDSKEAVQPADFALSQNYPNPFNPTTTIEYTLKQAADVTLTVYNTMGQKVKTLVNERMNTGAHSVQWDGTNTMGAKVVSGVYIYKLETENMSQTKKMLMVK